MSVTLDGLEDSFDNEAAERMLSLHVGKIIHTSEIIRKSMYDFDLETPEGIEKLMAMIPIMDPEILKDIMAELWPGYPTDIDARRHRLEIKGYLKDYLESANDEDLPLDEETTSEIEPGGPDADSQPEEPGQNVEAEVAPDASA